MNTYPGKKHDQTMLTILAFIGIINIFTAIYVGKKIKSIVPLVMTVVLIIMAVIVPVLGVILLIVVPGIYTIVFLGEYGKAVDLAYTISSYSIDTQKLRLPDEEQEKTLKSIFPDYILISKKLYSNDAYAVLASIAELSRNEEWLSSELSRKELRQQEEMRMRLEKEAQLAADEKIRQQEIKKAQAEAAKARFEAEKAEAERKMKELEAERAESERKIRELEAEKQRLTLERQKAIVGPNDTPFGASSAGLASSDLSRKLDVNTCSEEELSKLPGIGLVLAKKAISTRDSMRGFDSVEQFFDSINLIPHYREILVSYLVCIENKKEQKGRWIDI